MTEAIRWTIKVSKETDVSLRSYLGAQGMKRGDLSNFVEDAVRWRMFDRRAQTLKDRNQDASARGLGAEIDRAVRAVRKAGRRRAR